MGQQHIMTKIDTVSTMRQYVVYKAGRAVCNINDYPSSSLQRQQVLLLVLSTSTKRSHALPFQLKPTLI